MLLRKTKVLEKDIDLFIGKIQDINLVCHEAVKEYLNGDESHFQQHVATCRTLEAEVDDIRIEIEHNLYGGMLIPESRGDVLGILETLDDVADTAKEIVVGLDIERPEFTESIHDVYLKMASMSRDSVEELVNAVTMFFTNSDLTGGFIKQVNFYEHEIDKLEEELKRRVFADETISRLSHKMHLRYFIEKLAKLSDEAEAVCQRLALSTIKRSI